MAAAHPTPHLSPLHGMMFSSVTVSILLPADSPGKHDGVKLLGVATLIYYLSPYMLPRSRSAAAMPVDLACRTCQFRPENSRNPPFCDIMMLKDVFVSCDTSQIFV
jgi:hypothetical protein